MRVLVFSDVHLDRAYDWASAAIAAARRDVARQALVGVLAEARKQSVDLAVCVGDLFDRATVHPSTIRWVLTALGSADVPILIAPGDDDWLGPRSPYTEHRWPENVLVFDSDRLTPHSPTDGLTLWGAAHQEAHRRRSLLEQFHVDRSGVNIAVFHGTERTGRDREPDLEPCADFDDSDIQRSGLDHAFVGHYHLQHSGAHHTYPGAPLAHKLPGDRGTAILTTLEPEGPVTVQVLEVDTPGLLEIVVELQASDSADDVVERVREAVRHKPDAASLRLRGTLALDVSIALSDVGTQGVRFDPAIARIDEITIDFDADDLAREPSARGQFVRDVLASDLPEDRRQTVLTLGLRALAGHPTLEALR